MEQAHLLRTKHKPHLLFAMMRALACEDARISFEGKLSHTELARIEGACFEETETLRRGTIRPRMDFIVLPLTPETEAAIEKAIISKIAFKRYAGIVHVQIERCGAIAFRAHDHFHEDCVVAYSAVPVALLEKLVEKRILYSYESA